MKSNIILMILVMCGISVGSTYYVRADGSASKVEAVGPSSDATKCMSLVTYKAGTYVAGDTVVYNNLGGNYITEALTFPSGGTINSPIVYMGDPASKPVFKTTVACGCSCLASNVIIKDVEVSGVNTTSNFLFQAGTNIVTYNLRAANSLNQCYQHYSNLYITHNNLYASNAVDDGVSVHGSGTVIVNGGLISDFRQGINFVDGSKIYLNDVYFVKPKVSTGVYTWAFLPSFSIDSGLVVVNRCYFEEDSLNPYDTIMNFLNGNFVFKNCIFKNIPDTCIYMRIADTLSSFKVYNCTFTGTGGKRNVVESKLSSAVFKNNIFNALDSAVTTASLGTWDYNLFYNSGAGIGTHKVTTDPKLSIYGWIKEESGAIGTGVGPSADTDVPTVDIDGNIRNGATTDIGASMFSKTSTNNAPWLNGYTLRKKITVRPKLSVQNSLTYAQVRVVINDNGMGSKTNADGHDVRFTDSSGTGLLYYDRVYHRVSGDTLRAMYTVGTPLTTADAIVYMYYRSADTTNGENESGLYNQVGAVAAYHMQEGVGDTVFDHSGNGNKATIVGGSTWITGGGITLDGLNNYAVALPSASLNLFGKVTIESNIDCNSTGVIAGRLENQFFVWIETSSTGYARLRINSGTTSASRLYPINGAFDFAMSFDDSKDTSTWYQDGVNPYYVGGIIADMASDLTHSLYIGVDARDASGLDFLGNIYYSYIYNKVLSHDEIKWNHDNRYSTDLVFINNAESSDFITISKILPKKLRITSDSIGLDIEPKLFQFINTVSHDTDTLVIDNYTSNTIDFTLPNDLDTNKQYLLNAHFGSLMTTKRFKYVLKDNIMKLLWR